jgi:hypothetical protein
LNSGTVLSVTEKIIPVINKNWFIIIAVCAIMLFLGPGQAVKPPEKIEHIIMGILNLLKITL